MRYANLVIFFLLFPALVFGQATYQFDADVLSAQPSGTGTLLAMGNFQAVFCPGTGVLGKICSVLPGQVRVEVSGKIPVNDGDLAVLGAFPAEILTAKALGPDVDDLPNTWSFDGCVKNSEASGSGVLLTLERGQVLRSTFCGPGGSLGPACAALDIGDCAIFRGRFFTLGDDLFSSGHLDLMSITSQF